MIRVVYASRPTDRSETVLDDIVTASTRNNGRDGITGVLIFDDQFYLQVLEGPEDAVDRLLEKLQRDPRHTEISVVFRTRIETSSFPDWNIKVLRNDATQNPVLLAYATGNRIEPDRLLSEQLNALARDLAKYF